MNISSHSKSCVFIMLCFSFVKLHRAKILSLIRPHLFIFAFVSITLGDESKKILWQFMSKISLCFPL